jgi:hypothetical protein
VTLLPPATRDGAPPPFVPADAGQGRGAARWVSVAGVGPAVGATTVSALLSRFYASYRDYRIVAVDPQAGDSALGRRLGTASPAGLVDIAAAAADVGSFPALARHLGRTHDGTWMLVGGRAAPPDADECGSALDVLSRFFAVGVLDCGPIGAPISDTLVERAHAALFVARATTEGVLAAAGALDWLAPRRLGTGAWHAGVALVPAEAPPTCDLGRAAQLLRDRGGRVVGFPHDPGLATGRLGPATVSGGVWAATGRLAAELLAHAAAAAPIGRSA